MVAPGSGRVARRDRALLYLPDGASSNIANLFRWCDRDVLVDELTTLVLEDPDRTPAFAFIEWSDQTEAARIQVIVRGGVEVSSDVESMPQLSGTGSPTWVEHRVARIPELTRFRCGTSVDLDTDLRRGVVVGGGFELQLALRPTNPDAQASLHPQSFAHVPTISRAAPSVEPQPAPERTPASTASHPRARLARIASLAAAAGDEALVPPADTVRPVVASTEQQPLTSPDSHRHETTLPESAQSGLAKVPFGRTRSVHSQVELPDGSRHDLHITTVFGRRPSGEAAQAPDAVAIAFEAPPSVSRTHVRIETKGPALFVTDCASSRGTVVVPAGDSSPITLQPWTAQAIGNGDRLYLGGMETCLTVRRD